MEQSKYYVPKIEEFHIGFEYESLSDPRTPEKDSSWDKYTIDNVNNFQNFLLLYEKYDAMEIRVKYLDKEDLESLGFVWNSTMQNPNIQFFTKNLNYNKSIKENTNAILLRLCHQFPDGYYCEIKNFLDNTNIGFKGIIKNKSELKTLLKQLNIYDEDNTRLINGLSK